MRNYFRTVSRTCLIFALLSSFAIDCAIFQKAKAIRVRVLRASEIEKTRLADGTKFEKFVEKGDLPPLPLDEEEELEDLNDPRIGHFDKDGKIPIPVDSNGNILKGYEYLMNPITIDVDFDEKDSKSQPGESYDLPSGSETSGQKQKDYKPYTELEPKPEFMEEGENTGDEYDDVASEPAESLPVVPDLPKLDYSDSGEQDEDLKVSKTGEEEDTDRSDDEAPSKPVDVIYPNQNVEIPISQDDINEKSKTMDEIQEEEEIRGDKESGGRHVNIPINREESEDDEAAGMEGFDADENVMEKESERDPDEMTLEELEDLAKSFGKEVFGNVMDKASELAGSDDVQSESDDSSLDPNSIAAQSEIPSDSDGVKTVESEDLDGVVLPDQDDLSDDEIARIAAESVKPAEPVAPARPPVRGGRIGSGVQPDSATQHNIFIQFFLLSIAFLMF
ncbi:hypothetical protein L3Y34_003554 [Caenorhabditis briggsae]|uniref:Uncharacterized protein n=1 Tax=Caenorhabditis briggsae TaxID=6238 RepID=A0AAE9A9C6_CAEBR|nr:hypothetical protein L3Y34_003554 [Caenorhabditis briggsae]